MYNLPEFNPKIKNRIFSIVKNRVLWLGVLLVVAFAALGFSSGAFSLNYISEQIKSLTQIIEAPVSSDTAKTAENIYKSDISYEQAIINAVKSATGSVVSIIISKNLPVYEQKWINPFGQDSPFDFQIPQYVQKGTELKEVGAGSGFIVSADGLVLTNKHVVLNNKAEYTVFTNGGQKYSAKVLALDPVQDLAVIKIESKNVFQPIKLGDSSQIQIGQTAIAIGNALGQFTNTVSVGVVSGLQRTISASDRAGFFSEVLEGIIQTDAAINSGNSGGPLLNLKGEVIGINTAMAEGAQSIGFAIPINTAKKAIEQVIKTNKIVYPFLGVRYVSIDADVKQKYDLPVDYGVLVLKGSGGEPAITSGSAAEKAGIKEKDVILEINSEKIKLDNKMADIIRKYNPGDKITLKILRDGKEINLEAILAERPS